MLSERRQASSRGVSPWMLGAQGLAPYSSTRVRYISCWSCSTRQCSTVFSRAIDRLKVRLAQCGPRSSWLGLAWQWLLVSR
eukprot:scaffold112114_cov57-Phaeocystis_antarctica.AAC.2